jgi:Mn2+/Fe2+ NRAMP family transporter
MHLDMQIFNRVSSISVLVCIAAVTTTNCAIFSAAVYMRAHRKEPMLVVSIISGLLTAVVVWRGSTYGVFEMMLGYTVVTMLVALPWTMRLLHGYLVRHR